MQYPIRTSAMAKMLGVHPETLRRKVRSGSIPVECFIKVGKTDFRFYPEITTKWFKEQ